MSAPSGRHVALALLALLACDDDRPKPETRASASPAPSAVLPAPSAPALLFLPDAGDVALEGSLPAPALVPRAGPCPGDMVSIAGRFCIDRYETSLVEVRNGRSLSPYFPPRRSDLVAAWDAFRDLRPRASDAPELPSPPDFQLRENLAFRATSRAGVVPSGYLSGIVAAEACREAGKRLCTLAEWTFACRGERNRRFPYGDEYVDGACNVHREAHPASVLHGDASIHHLDPRLNLVAGSRGPLLRKTGATPRCRSEWSGDAVFDMVGNLDEWIEDENGTFVGAFYARASRDGCDAKIESHPVEYFDYSLGVRCCR